MTRETQSNWRPSNLLSVTLALGITTMAYFGLESLMNSITPHQRTQVATREYSPKYNPARTNYNGGLLLLTR